jgi:hypothetical protein
MCGTGHHLRDHKDIFIENRLELGSSVGDRLGHVVGRYAFNDLELRKLKLIQFKLLSL